MSSGGVGISYDFNNGIFNGQFFQYPKFAADGNFMLPCHPDTKVSLSGKVLPHWDIARDVTLSVCEYLSSLEYFGFDLMITDEGVKLCEINTLPDISDAQVLFGPILKNPNAKDFFTKKLNTKLNKNQI